ncbi:MAG: glycosyltransferase [Alphaproteobacteria bacterium]|jgi:dolichol-phosphate mannosyltransferase|nr:glycosyltransferase [Alphaproteobacteria bacterium]
MTETPPAAPRVTVVMPAWDEEDCIGAVLDELAEAFAGADRFEILCIDDGSTDATAARIRERMARYPWLRLVAHRRRSGKSAGLRTGAEWARGAWIVTMDADGQNVGTDIRALADRVAGLEARPSPLIAGIRTARQDTLSRRVASKIANPIRQWALGDACPDSGCGVKAYRRDAFLRLPVFEGMHRFLPPLFNLYGHPLELQPIGHRPRHGGASKYTNWRRALVGIVDLLGVLWLRRRTAVAEADPGPEGQPAGTWVNTHDPY